MANWSKNFTNISTINGGREFELNDYPTTDGFNVPINNSQYLYDNCVGTYQQSFTDEKKAQARNNIGAGTSNFSGNYNDLSNKPTLFSGNYNDLTNKPTIPVVDQSLNASSSNAIANKIVASNINSINDNINRIDNYLPFNWGISTSYVEFDAQNSHVYIVFIYSSVSSKLFSDIIVTRLYGGYSQVYSAGGTCYYDGNVVHRTSSDYAILGALDLIDI